MGGWVLQVGGHVAGREGGGEGGREQSSYALL